MNRPANPQSLVDDLVDLLQLTPLGEDRFEGPPTPPTAVSGRSRVYGGQVIAQALAAGAATAPDDRPVHSLHAYFLRMGDGARPIRYDVSRDLDGGSFSNRRVVAVQDERPLLSLAASFQRVEEGLHHQLEMPQVPDPEGLVPDHLRRSQHPHVFPETSHDALFSERPIELCTIETPRWLDPSPAEPVTHCWLRTPAPVGDDPRLHRAILAYASDMALMPTAMLPHGVSFFGGGLVDASLDHAVWFHEDFRVDDWLLYQTHSAWSGHGRGFITGRIWRRDGTLVASVSQEGMMRLRKQ